jgi:tRNA A-37 threonylcarbamoyl transferase component Bud32
LNKTGLKASKWNKNSNRFEEKSRLIIRDGQVYKYFSDPGAYHREMAAYSLALPQTPRLIRWNEPDLIVLEQVQGTPYLDLPLDTRICVLLADTISAFHLATLQEGRCICHWDNQPRNILIKDTSCWLIDFSDSREAAPEDDISHLLLFWAGEFETNTFQKLAQEFISRYLQFVTLSPETWKPACERSVHRFDERRSRFGHRKLSIPHHTQTSNRQFLAQLV